MSDQIEVDWNQFSQLDEYNKIQFGISLFEGLQLQNAKQAFQLILQQNHFNIEALDHLTDIMDQLNENQLLESTIQPYLVPQNEQIIRQYPNGYKLLFKYAQQKHGEESIKFYKIGIDLLLSQSLSSGLSKQQTRDIADAYAAIAETYQTDLLEHKASEQGCLEAIEQAFKFDPQNLDAQLQVAQYHLNKEDEVKAKQQLQLVYDRVMSPDVEETLEQDFLLQISKLLVEVEDYEKSEKILQKAIDINQQDAEVQYMLAFSKLKLKKYAESHNIATLILNIPGIQDDLEIFTGTKELIAELEKHDLTAPQNVEDEEWMDIE